MRTLRYTEPENTSCSIQNHHLPEDRCWKLVLRHNPKDISHTGLKLVPKVQERGIKKCLFAVYFTKLPES